jgi:uncharacterized SAM-binding protein YcdF (DUF218 family)
MIFWPIKMVFRIISLLITVVVMYFAITFVQVWLTGHRHSSANAQAILVFGTAEDNGVPSPELQSRLDHALTLWNEHRAPWIVVTGGKRPGDVYTESGVSATYLIALGVPASDILRGYGSDTWQNVATALPAMQLHHIVTVLTVTDPFHEDRAMAISSSQGLSPFPSPVDEKSFSSWNYYFKETFEVGVGRIIGYHRLSQWTGGSVSS